MPELGSPRAGRCWYCGNATLLEHDPPEHIVPAAIGGSLLTKKVCFACNQRAGGEVDEPFLGEWGVVLVRREQMILGRRGEKPPKLPQRATLEDGTRIEVDVWGGPWGARPYPKVKRVGDEYHVSAADDEEVRRIQSDLERKAAARGETLTPGEPQPQQLPPAVNVTFSLRPQVWLRMTAKMALGTASLVWDDSWLDTASARELIATLWDPDPRTPHGEPAGLIPTRPEGPLQHLCEPPEHLLFFLGGRDESKFIAILLGSEVVGLPLTREAQPHPQAVWLMDGRGGSARELTFDALMLAAGQRAGLIPNLDEIDNEHRT